jgi:hypothetical protein
MIDRGHDLPLVRQAELLRLSRSTLWRGFPIVDFSRSGASIATDRHRLHQSRREVAMTEIPVCTSLKDRIDPKPQAPLVSMLLFVPRYRAAKALSRDSRRYT